MPTTLTRARSDLPKATRQRWECADLKLLKFMNHQTNLLTWNELSGTESTACDTKHGFYIMGKKTSTMKPARGSQDGTTAVNALSKFVGRKNY
jgi:hypothetical protein